MTFKMPKPVLRIFLGLVMISFVAVACNDGDKKEGTKETPKTEEPAAPVTPAPAVDDSIKAKPVEGGN